MEFRPEFYKEFCVRQIGTKSPSWSLCVTVVTQSDLFKGIWPPHARRSGPLVETPGSTTTAASSSVTNTVTTIVASPTCRRLHHHHLRR